VNPTFLVLFPTVEWFWPDLLPVWPGFGLAPLIYSDDLKDVSRT
jgi:hypothetical protein